MVSMTASTRASSIGLAIGALVLLVAVTLMTAVVARVDSQTDAFQVAITADAAPLASASLAPRCALQYTAVLDLAELGRSYGKTSGAYRHAFGHAFGKMNDCRVGQQYAAMSRQAGHGLGSKSGLT
jgi:hypothetical protein